MFTSALNVLKIFCGFNKHLKTCILFIGAGNIENKLLACYNTVALLRARQVTRGPELHRGICNLSCSPSEGRGLDKSILYPLLI